jgi:multiple sugar transport system substrate-binding protein
MRKLRFLFIGFLLLAVVTQAFTGGQKQQEAVGKDGPVNLRFTIWTGFGPHLDLLNEIADTYRKDHPNVTIEYDSFIFPEYNEKITLQLSGNDPPDGGWIVERAAPTFIDAGVLADMKEHLEKKEGYDFTDFSKPPMKLWEIKEGVYGVPFSTSPFVTYYNKDLFDAAGVPTPTVEAKSGNWTWETLRTSGKKIKAATGVWSYQNKGGTGFTKTPLETLGPLLKAYGTTPWDDSGTKCLLTTRETIEAITIYHKMIFEDKAAVPPGNESNYFVGQAATTTSQISHARKLKDSKFAWDIAPLTGGPAGETHLIGQAAIAAFQNSKNRDTVIDFISHMTNKENVTKMMVFFPPARKSVIDSPDFDNSNPLISSESMKIVGEGIKNGTIMSAHVNFPKINLIMQGEFDKLWVPNADIEAVLKETCKKVSPFLK